MNCIISFRQLPACQWRPIYSVYAMNHAFLRLHHLLYLHAWKRVHSLYMYISSLIVFPGKHQLIWVKPTSSGFYNSSCEHINPGLWMNINEHRWWGMKTNVSILFFNNIKKIVLEIKRLGMLLTYMNKRL